MIRTTLSCAALLLLSTSWFTPASRVARPDRHPGHETFAEAEVNGEAGTLEVALRVDSMDLERSLRANHAKPPRLEDAAVEPLLEQLLKAGFLVRSPKGGPGRLNYVGYELEGLDVWLYFEIELPRRGRTLQISNQMLFDVAPGQLHRVSVRALDGDCMLLLDLQSPWSDLGKLAWREAHLAPNQPPPWARLWFEATRAALTL